MEQPNAEMAWNDFTQFRNSKTNLPTKKPWYLSKISLSVIALLLISIGVLSGYQLALINNSTDTAKTSLGIESKIVSRKSVSTIENRSNSTNNNIQKSNKTETVFASNQRSSNLIPAKDYIKSKVITPVKIETGLETTQIDKKEVNETQTASTFLSENTNEAFNSSNNSITISSVDNFTNETSFENQSSSSITTDQTSTKGEANSKPEVQSKESNKSDISEDEITNPYSDYINTNTTNNSSTIAPSTYTETGSARKGHRMNAKAYLSVFKRYTDISFYSLENGNDLTSEMHSKFTLNPANSGIDNRYSISAGTKSDFIQSKNELFDMQNRDSYIGNSFTLLNNNVGVGLAVQNTSFPNTNGLNFYLSSAYKISIAKNSNLRLGIGLSSSSISITETDASKSDLSIFSFHIGARYMYKTLYAQLSFNNVAPVITRNDFSSNYQLSTTAHMSFGGRLFLSKSWAIHPQFSLTTNTKNNLKVGLLSSLSFQNKWMVGIQTNDFKSIGIHMGTYVNRRFSAILKTDICHFASSNSSLMQTGELMLKIELGRFKR